MATSRTIKPRTIKRKKRTSVKTNRLFSFLPEPMQIFLARRLMDIFAALFAFGGAFLLVSLLTYTHTDPSANSAGNGAQDIANWGGASGAWMSDILAQSIGIGGFALALGAVIWGIRFFRRHPVSFFPLRIIALMACAVFTAIAFSQIPAGDWIVHPFLGSSTGTLFMERLNGALPIGGALISVLCSIVAFGLFIFSGAVSRNELIKTLTITKFIITTATFFVLDTVTGFTDWVRHYNDPDYAPQEKPRRIRAPKTKTPKSEKTTKATKIAPEISTTIASKPTPAATTQPSIPVVKTAQSSGAQATGQTQQQFLYEGEWTFPDASLLEDTPEESETEQLDEGALRKNAELLQNVLADFKIDGDIVSIHPGPVVTLYELEPAPGTKSSKVINIGDDIARSMSAVSVRCAVVPGRNVIGIELPNKKRQFVYMQEMVNSKLFDKTKAGLPLILGKDIGGQPILADLSKMPHLLVAGTTGSGKSVAVNTMILSLLFRLSPEQCRFIMIDPKMLELSVYDGIPHLLSPVVTEPGKAVVALKWTVAEMENRYRAMSKLGVRNMDGYNERVKEAAKNGETITTRVQTGFDGETGKAIYEEQPMDLTPLPYIVVIVDEFADLMLVAGKDVEAAIQRLAQMARAAGIHLIMATQRPSVDVITGVIKANFPTRISFSVTSKIDSRTILGEGGAEQLLGMGDMLYMAPGGRITRVHGPFVSDDDVEKVVSFLKSQADPKYIGDITDSEGLDASEVMHAMFEDRKANNDGEKVDELYDEAVALVAREGKASTSFVQRYLQIGYNRAARIIEEMERQGVISKATKTGKRDVLIGDVSEF